MTADLRRGEAAAIRADVADGIGPLRTHSGRGAGTHELIGGDAAMVGRVRSGAEIARVLARAAAWHRSAPARDEKLVS
jgi:hypothetical protein